MTDIESTFPPARREPGVAQFYVVPWSLEKVNHNGKEVKLVDCRYYDHCWNPIENGPMTSDENFFRLTQSPRAPGKDQPPQPLDLTLMSAVAKTLESPCNLNNSFVASGEPQQTSLVVPVLPNSTRGVILVFRSPAGGDKVDFLVATSDPEIKSGSNNSDD